MIGRLAANDVPALIVGERGTGKQLVVATIHDNSPRRDRPFVSIDCAAVPDAVLEAELFGARPARCSWPPSSAAAAAADALTRALSDAARGPCRRPRGCGRASSRRPIRTEALRGGRVQPRAVRCARSSRCSLPPLRERRDDIPLLVRHFIQRFNAELNRAIRGVDEGRAELQEHAWPGNVGELERVIKRACIVARSDVITADDVGGRWPQPMPARRTSSRRWSARCARRCRSARRCLRRERRRRSTTSSIWSRRRS